MPQTGQDSRTAEDEMLRHVRFFCPYRMQEGRVKWCVNKKTVSLRAFHGQGG